MQTQCTESRVFLQSDIDVDVGNLTPADDDEDGADDLATIVQAVATDTAIICSALVALQDITADMGPTHVWAGTNTVQHHATLWNTAVGSKLDVTSADAAFGIQHKKMCLKKGDLVLYDSRTMHCGGANSVNGSRRSVMVVSTMSPGIRPDGTTWTILPALKNRLSLSDFPLPASFAVAEVCSPGCIALPAYDVDANIEAEEEKTCGKPIPPIEEWQSAVQCTLCKKWRPVTAEDAPRFTTTDNGFLCKNAGFVCLQPQVYTLEQIDAQME